MPSKKAVTLQTIADELNLTIHTVSKALRGLPGMSETTRRTVVERARELGYRTKEQEAGMTAERIPSVRARPRRFAMLLSGDLPFHRQQTVGVQTRLAELGHTLYPLVVPSGLSEPSELESWLEKIGAEFTDGLFLSAVLPERLEAALLRIPMPKVLINYPSDLAEVDSVVWDVEYAVHRSMEALYANGHRNVLYVGEIEPFRGFRLRWRAFAIALKRAGAERAPDPDEHVTSDSGDRVEWMEKLRSRLSSGRYTAVFCAIPGTAEWAYAAAASLGLDVPESVSLVGMEHEEHPYLPDLARPALFVKEAGERAAELMLRRIANPTLPYEHVRLKGPFLEGRTLRRL
ncbi:LacI family transcriptional regulator [Paenibacillus antri]|uniref:LacI family transcriptional regulator n=1 Tax=Paenibacillus antri TaxID=2582848 RepID=A0A5R9FZY7_9BACL|nr:LacI family DNA-binding transcriptional regulator [Paenibacillus antri]TLS49081.1 LacI family transcriptional regulator [Paenibacillus antri]